MTTAAKPSTSRRPTWAVLLLALLVALAGYFGAWVPHRAAGLVVTGLDLAEYVKFVPQVAGGEIIVLRESFYAPLVAGSLIAALLAGRQRLPRLVRLAAWVAAFPLALAMLPPAWSPVKLLEPQFRLQVLAILFCFLFALLVPLTRLLPDRLALLFIAALALPAAVWPAWGFLRVLPAIAELYRRAVLLPGWGFWACLAGLAAAAVLAIAAAVSRKL